MPYYPPPSVIFEPPVPDAWYVADDIAGADDDPIATWVDRSGNGYDLTAPTSANRPTLKKDIINGHAVVRYPRTGPTKGQTQVLVSDDLGARLGTTQSPIGPNVSITQLDVGGPGQNARWSVEVLIGEGTWGIYEDPASDIRYDIADIPVGATAADLMLSLDSGSYHDDPPDTYVGSYATVTGTGTTLDPYIIEFIGGYGEQVVDVGEVPTPAPAPPELIPYTVAVALRVDDPLDFVASSWGVGCQNVDDLNVNYSEMDHQTDGTISAAHSNAEGDLLQGTSVGTVSGWHVATTTFDAGALTASGGTAIVRVAGEDVAPSVLFDRCFVGGTGLAITEEAEGTLYRMKGDIAELRLFLRVLSDQELAAVITDMRISYAI